LVKLYRDEYGVPYPSEAVMVEDPETGVEVPGGRCWQPLAFNVSDEVDALCPESCVETPFPATDVDVVAVDQYSCAIEDGCAGCTQEVDFGRMNSARAPDSVFASQLDDVVVNLATADCLTLDPAGRLVASRVDENGLVTSAAIDSPLQNMAIYKQLMIEGYLGDEENPITLPESILETAARALGAASAKDGEVNVDMVAYLNQLMGLSDPDTPTVLEKVCKIYRKEVMGNVEEVEKCFLDYTKNPEMGTNYQYRRNVNFNSLPHPPYIQPDRANSMFEYLYVKNETPTFAVATGRVLSAVFCVDSNGNPILPTTRNGACTGEIDQFLDRNISGFAQAADDTRAVINFLHYWALPGIYDTPVACEAADNGIIYDLSISPESGLQVPVQMVSTTEGREFIVTIANAGPDTANGTVLVTAKTGDDDSTAVVEIVESGDPAYWKAGAERFEFPIVDLAAGRSASWTVFFSISEPMATTISWTATAVAGEAETDPNLGNNTVSKTTTVMLTAGGGGGAGKR
ncbi:MAG: hypothetical protein ACSLFH_00570, partial [Desulfuromonadales bacterium]